MTTQINKNKQVSVTPKILSCQCLDSKLQPSAGLFRSLKATSNNIYGASTPEKNGYDIHIIQKYTDKKLNTEKTNYWKIDTTYALNIHDRKILLSILHLILYDSKRETSVTDPIEKTFKNETYHINTSLTELSKLAYKEKANSAQIKNIMNSLYKLAKVSILKYDSLEALTTKFGEAVDKQLISYDKKGNDLIIEINPYLSYSISSYFKTDSDFNMYQYSIINLDEVNLLKKDTSQLLHNYLSAFTNNKKEMKFGIEKLRENIFGVKSDRKSLYKQRKNIKEAMTEIGNLENWTIAENDEVYTIIRK